MKKSLGPSSKNICSTNWSHYPRINGGTNYSLVLINNKGNGSLSIGQELTYVFNSTDNNASTANSLTWADFNNDGYMDLFVGTGGTVGKNTATTGGNIYYNKGDGTLSNTPTKIEEKNTTG